MSSLSWTCSACGLTNGKNIVCQACMNNSPLDHKNKLINDCKLILNKYNQSHIFNHLNDIRTNEELNQLISQIYSIDFDKISSLYNRAILEEKNDNNLKNNKISPFPHSLAFDRSNINVNKLVKIGCQSIINNECCIIILAGGQGTRLGFNKPKGCFNINLLSQKSIYQLQIEKALAVKRYASSICNISQLYNIKLPIYFMTSDATHDQTKAFLNINNYFKYDYFDIKLFKQQNHPCLTESGKFIMESANKIAMSPNGNGGIYSSLAASGIYSDMFQKGIKYIQIFGIDNILARIGDPLWFGHFIDTQSDSANKTCIKIDPHEKVGIMCLKNGAPSVTEYTELTDDMINMKQDNNSNRLSYCYANLAMHLFHIDHITRICNEPDVYKLPIHIARKKIPFYDISTKKTIKKNGIKLEFFVFDTYQYSSKCTVFNILRKEEFAPVKKSNGNCSPKTARYAHSKYWKNEIIKNGAKFINDDNDPDNDNQDEDNILCEVSPLYSYLPYNYDNNNQLKEKVNGKTFRLPYYFHTK